MGVYERERSPYWWIKLESTGERFSSKIRVRAATPQQTARNRKLADDVYHTRMGDLVREQNGIAVQAPAASVSFDERAEWYEKNCTPKHGGKSSEVRKIARLRRFFGEMAVKAITPNRWTEYETERVTVDGVVLATVGRELALMKSILNASIGEGLDFNPLQSVKRQGSKVKAKRTVTGKEARTFLAALKKIDPEIHDMYVVGVGTLLRRENLLTLRRCDLLKDRLSVYTKTGPHEVPLTGPTPLQLAAAKVLRARLPEKHTGYFFPHWQATFAKYEDVGHPSVLFLKKVKRAAKAADIPWGLEHGGIVWHTATRASGATRMLREHKVDVRTVQLVGGWASLDQMAEYLGLDLDLAGVAAAGAGVAP